MNNIYLVGAMREARALSRQDGGRTWVGVGRCFILYFMCVYQQPFVTNTDAKVSCCCWNGGTVNATLRINRRCFVPGETIHVDAEIVNNSKANVNAVKLRLVQVTQRLT